MKSKKFERRKNVHVKNVLYGTKMYIFGIFRQLFLFTSEKVTSYYQFLLLRLYFSIRLAMLA